MTLVAVIVEGMHTALEKESKAYVLTSPSQADEILHAAVKRTGLGVLFFSVPRSIVIPLCSGLTEDAWTD